MTPGIIFPVASSLIGVPVGGGLQYFFGRALESEKQFALQKAQAYSDFFQAVALSAQHQSSAELRSAIVDAKVRVCIYGSAQVIDCLSAFEKAGGSARRLPGRSAMLELLIAMRSDIGRRRADAVREQMNIVLFGAAPERDSE